MTIRTLTNALLQLVEKRYRLLQIVLVVVLVAAGYSILLNNQIKNIRDVGILTLQQTKKKQEAKTALLSVTKELVAKYTAINTREAKKMSALAPSTADLPALFVQVDALAQASGLLLTNVNFSGASTEQAKSTAAAGSSGLKQVAVTFTVLGGNGYASLKDFLATLESSNRLLDVQSLSYAPGKEGAEVYLINAVTYYLGS